jgi:hypothetical protein
LPFRRVIQLTTLGNFSCSVDYCTTNCEGDYIDIVYSILGHLVSIIIHLYLLNRDKRLVKRRTSCEFFHTLRYIQLGLVEIVILRKSIGFNYVMTHLESERVDV